MNLTDEFTALISGLQEAKVEFAVCGGMAMALHGFPRFTNDIDFLLPTAHLAAALAAAKNCGFDDEVESLRLGQHSGHPVEIQRINKFREGDFLTLDLVLVSPILESVWQGRLQFEGSGHSLDVVAAAGLAKMKLLAGRPQDLLDIQTLGFILDDPSIQP